METVPLRQVTVLEVAEHLQRQGDRIATHKVLLQDDLRRPFHLPLGPCEALGIQLALKNDLVPRPMTHDLIHTVLTRLGGEVERVLIERAGNGWRARVRLRSSSGSYLLEANHGDAIALALRGNAPIFATEEAIAAAKVSSDSGEA